MNHFQQCSKVYLGFLVPIFGDKGHLYPIQEASTTHQMTRGVTPLQVFESHSCCSVSCQPMSLRVNRCSVPPL